MKTISLKIGKTKLINQNLKKKVTIDFLKTVNNVENNADNVLFPTLLLHYIQPGRKISVQKITVAESNLVF